MNNEIKKRIRELRRRHGIPTAEKGVPLFQRGTKGKGSCVANVYASDDMRALGFKAAADKLIEVADKEPQNLDLFVYSVGYLYRMYLESRLKEIIEGATGKPLDKRLQNHDLLKLWKEAKPIMASSSNWFDDKELEAVEEKLQEFSRIDPSSDAFRYSRNKKGKSTLQGIQTLDLRHLKEVMDSIFTALEGSSTAIYEDRKTG